MERGRGERPGGPRERPNTRREHPLAPTRGRQRQPRVQLDIDQIVDAAMAIADRQGPAAMTMRAIAAELGVGVMSLYWYVPTKRDLEAAVLERLMLDSSPPEDPTGDWRVDLSSIAWAARENLLRHAWMVDFFSSAQFMSPEALGHGLMRHIENSMRMVASLPFDFPTKMTIIGAVDDFTRGFTFGEIAERQQLERVGHTHEEMQRLAEPRMRDLLEEGNYPLMREFMAHDQELPDQDTRFADGLSLILDGVAHQLAAIDSSLSGEMAP